MPQKVDLVPSVGIAPIALVLLLVGPLLALLLRRRWRREAERQEEVRRLMILAAEEAERAEIEAAIGHMGSYPEYFPARTLAPAPAPTAAPGPAMAPLQARVTTSFAPPQGQVCALCFNPANAKCSRCKAVRYCSGKCQIIHWRQGHKDECHPSNANDEYSGKNTAFPSRREEFHQPGPADGTLDLEGAKEFRTFPESCVAEYLSSHTDSSEVHVLADKISVEATGHTAGSTAPVPKCSTSSGSKSIAEDTTKSAEPTLLQNASLELSSTFAVSLNGHRATTDHSDDNPTITPPKPVTANSIEKTVTYQSQKNAFSSKVDAVECSNSDQADGVATISDDKTDCEHSKSIGKVQTNKPAKSKAETPDVSISSDTCATGDTSSSYILPKKLQSKDTDTQVRQIRLDSSTTGSVVVSELSKKKHMPLIVGGKSLNIESVPTRSSNGTDSTPISEKKLVDQSVAMHSKRYPQEMMLFPYELFIKLYNNDKVELRPCGLSNCGNSCYANSVLQCLVFTRPLTAYLLEGLHSKTCPKREWCFICEFEGLLMKMKRGKSPLSPIGILSHLENIGSSFGLGREEDAHEFLRYATDAMQLVCLKEAGAKPGCLLAEETTLIQQTFGGYLRSRIKCGRCKGRTERFERMMDLTVEIQGDIDSLEEALSRFTSTEVLDGENKYECNRCRSYERAKKRLTILEAPNVLTIALKRFQAGAYGKLNKPVRFPEYLDLAPYMSGTDDRSPIYGLYALVVHMDVMNASFSGHYICYVKDTQGNWYKADDSKVTKVDLSEVLSKGAYLLLYARCSPRAPSSVRRAMAHELFQMKRIRSKDIRGKSNSNISQHCPSGAQFRPRETMDDTDRFNERHHHTVNDYSSDSSSLFSCSDEGSWSTDSTRDSMITEELWEFFSGESDQMSLNGPFRFSEDSDGFTDSPLSSSRHSAEVAFMGRGQDLSRKGGPSNASSSGREQNDAEETERNGGSHMMKHGDSRGAAAWFEGDEIPSSFLHTEKSKHLRNAVDNFSRSTETDWINHNSEELKSSVLSRRPTRDNRNTSQTFY